MDRRLPYLLPYLTVGSRRRAAAAAVIMLVSVPASNAFAQTLTDPNPPKWSPPQAAAKSPSATNAKPCTGYGVGFVKVPGTDACVKIGGWMSVEGSTGR
jgi:hypothetical protein